MGYLLEAEDSRDVCKRNCSIGKCDDDVNVFYLGEPTTYILVVDLMESTHPLVGIQQGNHIHNLYFAA
jgi:hypothetical protein